jgi:2'-5' RNA ligase
MNSAGTSKRARSSMASKELILPAGVRSVDLEARSAANPQKMTRRRRYGVPTGAGGSQRLVVRDDPVFGEIGTSGLRQYGGFVLEEWLPKLRGRYGAWAYRELMDNSPIVGGIMFAVKQLARQVEWRVDDDVEIKGLPCGFVESCMHDMSGTWLDCISEILSFCGYGWGLCETVYKRRTGENPLPEYEFNTNELAVPDTEEDTDFVPPSSRYKDGLIGWRKLPLRAQETLMRWRFTGYSSLRGMEQVDWHGGQNIVPMGKALLFRTETTRQNPEGRALALDTPIPTPDGWKTMADLKVGSLVYDENERPCVVTAVADWENRPCIRLCFEDARNVVADVQHQWPVNHPYDGRCLFSTAQVLQYWAKFGPIEIGPCRVVNAFSVPSRTTRCIEVDSPSHLFLAGEAMVPTHNSLLRNAWTSWFALQNIQTIEAIGIERDLAGIPVLVPPDGVDLTQPAYSRLLEIAEDLVQGLRRDEDEGVVLPQKGWELSLMSTGGSRQIDTDAVIRRYEQRMTVALLADWLILGQDSIGSYAMVDVKSDLFGLAIDAILDLICEVFNRYGIPRLLALNGMKPTERPKIAHSSVGRVDLRTIGEFLTNMSIAGLPIPWDETLVEHLWRGASLPPPNFDGPKLAVALPSPTAHDSQWRPAWGSENAPSEEPPAPAPPQERDHIAKADQQHGVMVALYPSADVARTLAHPGGEAARDLHVTLAYLGSVDHVEDPDRLRTVVQGFAASCPPLAGSIAGTGVFTTGEEPVLYASPDVPSLPQIRHRLVEHLEAAGYPPSREHGFTPHITLSYGYPGSPPSYNQTPLRFDTLSVCIGGQRSDYPLSPNAIVKADSEPAQHGLALDGPLMERARLLSLQLEREMEVALDQLGAEAATAYATVAEKSMTPRQLQRLVGHVMSQTHIKEWLQTRLKPLLRNHAGRVISDTARTVGQHLGVAPHIPETEVRKIEGAAGKHLKLRDLEPQVRESVEASILEGLRAGENPVKTAARIRQNVPKGRFRHAGARWRAQLIARNETANLQRQATLATYATVPYIDHVEVSDGIYGPPRSDEVCIHRAGEVVPLDEAITIAPALHPLCTVSYNPIVSIPPVEAMAA